MGAVQKLATVVIIGLVALATVLVVYLADEPNRRGIEASEQDHLAIERGTELYITYCLQCHGPAGLGSTAGEEPQRIGPPLNQSFLNLDPAESTVFQSDNVAERQEAEQFIRFRITHGAPPDPRQPKVMPAFGQDLNVEEVNDLVYLIMNGDWNYVYNQAVLTTGEAVAQAECEASAAEQAADAGSEGCEDIDDVVPVYPTVPPPLDAETEQASTPAASGEGGAVLLEARDPADWSQTEITVAPGDTLQVVNAGVLEHDFTVDELGIAQDLTDEPVEITIPADAAPGTYEFYCSVPGHKESGMVGTLTIEGSS